MKSPIITLGSESANSSVCPFSSPYFAMRLAFPAIWLFTSLWKAKKMATAARAADVTANALVVAFVVLPTASSSSVTSRTPLSSPAISTIPFALSVIGPKESMDMITPVSESSAIVAIAVL